MTQRSAEIAHQVLSCFQENSSYKDYRDGYDTPFTDQEYSQLLHELAVIAYPPTQSKDHGNNPGATAAAQG